MSTTPQSTHEPAAETSLRVTHLVFGLIFLGIVAVWAFGASSLTLGVDVDADVVLPLILIGAGALGLVAMLATGARRRRSAN